ncbi:MAG TPA: hypothetical protein VGO93_08075, partial [Candidatus Xenobia bacterium]
TPCVRLDVSTNHPHAASTLSRVSTAASTVPLPSSACTAATNGTLESGSKLICSGPPPSDLHTHNDGHDQDSQQEPGRSTGS